MDSNKDRLFSDATEQRFNYVREYILGLEEEAEVQRGTQDPQSRELNYSYRAKPVTRAATHGFRLSRRHRRQSVQPNPANADHCGSVL